MVKCYAQSLFQGSYKPIKKIVIPQISSTTITRPFERSDRKITVIIFINDIVVHSLTFMILVLLNTKKKRNIDYKIYFDERFKGFLEILVSAEFSNSLKYIIYFFNQTVFWRPLNVLR